MSISILRDADSRLSSAILTVLVGFAVLELYLKLRKFGREYIFLKVFYFDVVDDSLALSLA